MEHPLSNEPKPFDGQIDPQTGLSHDYSQQYNALCMNYKLGEQRFMSLMRTRRERRNGKLFLRYEEEYPPTKYTDVVTDKNRAGVAQLDAIVDDLNQRVEAGTLTPDDAMEKFREMDTIIRGVRPTW